MAKKPEEKKDGTLVDNLPIEGTVAKGYVPEGFKSVEDFLIDMRKQYQADIDFDRLNRTAALEDKKFAAGEQWDPIVLEQRKGLPCLVINQIPQFTAQLVGDFKESQKAVKVIPSNDEDEDVASVRGDLIRSIEMQSRAQRVYDSTFESLVQCGDGAYRIAVEYARDDIFDQDIFIRPIDDCLAVVWDRFSVDPTGRDARRVFVDDKIPKDEYKRKWPEIQPDELISDDTIRKLSLEGWIDQDAYRVTEYWRLIERQRILAMFQNGKVFEISSENQDQLIQQNGNPVKLRTSWCTYAQMHLVTGFAILSGPYEYRLNRLPVIRMSGRVVNIGGRRVRYGLVRFMKDAARLKNFWRSVAAEQLGYAPKAKWMATQSAVEGREETIRKAHLSRDPLLIFNDEAVFGTNVLPVQPPGIEAALLNEANVNTQDMKDVTGIQDASLGIRSNETSGKAIMARQHEGDIASLSFYDNANEAILEGGDVINQLIPQIYDGTRVIRTIGEDESQKFIRINDPMDPQAIDLSVGMFDVALSTGTSYTTRREAAAQAMMDAVQVWPQLMSVAGDLVAKAQDWPGADKLAERLKKTIPPQFLTDDEKADGAGPGITPEQMQQAQAEIQQLMQELKTLKTDKSIDIAKLQIDTYKAETDRIKALSDNQVDGNPMEEMAIQHILETSTQMGEHGMRQQEMAHEFTMAQVAHEQAMELQQQQAQAAQQQAAQQAKFKQNSTPAAKSTSSSRK